jgi:hypothetical protein
LTFPRDKVGLHDMAEHDREAHGKVRTGILPSNS